MSRTAMTRLILYACPRGVLATQIKTYLQLTQQRYGPNAAHAYMPHCTLTGFFSDQESAISGYVKTLEKVWGKHLQDSPKASIEIEQMLFREHWHGLALRANWLKRLTAEFAQQADSQTRPEAIRLKDWLHLSLAYDFNPEDGPKLQQLATELIDPSATVDWEMRFYQRSEQQQWTCHRSWPIEDKS